MPKAHRARLERPTLSRERDAAQFLRERVIVSVLQAVGVPWQPELQAIACQVLHALKTLVLIESKAGEPELAKLELLLRRVVALPDVESLLLLVPVQTY